MTDNLLPSPAEVRCRISLDLAMQIRMLAADAGAVNLDEAKLAEQASQVRDQDVVGRLHEVLPRAEIDRDSSDHGIAIESLTARLPFVFAIWVYQSALTADALRPMIIRFAEGQRPRQESTG
ncbi:hypothetical protein O7631_17325 [Micromonospora sp. WMMD967]|uniref:hypothetical protein n=1 Tax=Micromonospora sp. WMMD967 TaxID=3016101 RepID=UPI002415DEC2|nr:hypothetical protein [Micromonospora sp. WMMD967]MDG4838282.1 hypothetical protein [Micromonospora sp. WMMD967]